MADVYCDAGKQKIIDIIDGTATSPVDIGTGNNFVGWGTGAGTAAEANTTLFTEASETRVGGTISQVTTTVTGDTYQTVATITADAGKTITNAGVFDASTSGSLIVKGDFTGIVLSTGDKIEFTITLQQDA